MARCVAVVQQCSAAARALAAAGPGPRSGGGSGSVSADVPVSALTAAAAQALRALVTLALHPDGMAQCVSNRPTPGVEGYVQPRSLLSWPYPQQHRLMCPLQVPQLSITLAPLAGLHHLVMSWL
jgi:hypothetical protein